MEFFGFQRTSPASTSLLILFPLLFPNVNSICESITPASSILWLQNGRRCLWMPASSAISWTAAMNYCVSQGGYLAHVYNSDDRAKILAWKVASTNIYKVAHLGLYKDSKHYQEDGSSTHWKLNNSVTLPIELKAQYTGLVNDWGTVYLLNIILGLLPLDSYQPFTIQPSTLMTFSNDNGIPICEQSTSRMRATYTAYAGKISPATVWLTQTGKATSRDCARYCAKLQYCMGYNVVVVSSTSITCQYIVERLIDTGASLVANVNSVYYEFNLV
uniref:C-type lectin domain-containing protein n=1 Tax=Plectus sambesii TaxID=2011161 RepID=A0A914XBB1_9BILA